MCVLSEALETKRSQIYYFTKNLVLATMCRNSWFWFFLNAAVSLTNILKNVKIDVFSHLLSCLPTFRYARKLETLNFAFLRIYWSYNLSRKPKTFKKFESYTNWILNTKYWKPKGSDCTLSNGRIFGLNFYELHCHKILNNC